MNHLRRVSALTLAVGLLLPAAATAGASAASGAPGGARSEQGVGNGKGPSGKGACLREARATYKATLRAAHTAKKDAYRAARQEWLASTVEQRAALSEALASATTEEEHRAAREAFQESTSTEREARQTAKAEARTAFKSAQSTARETFRAARGDCRAA